jgi:tRNA nucleotidyltransferase/poly(A) polymerase
LKLVGQYGFSLEPETASALAASLPLITRCSHSRLALEFEKIIKSPYSEKIFPAFHEYGFLAYYLPFLNERWNTPEREYMLDLLAERNRRLLSGKYRDSISLAIATAALPFVVGKLTNTSGDIRKAMWSYYYGVEKDIRGVVYDLLAPYSFPKRIIASSVGMLLLQPAMFEMKRKNRTMQNKRYRHARELMTLQNNVAPRGSEIEEFWPLHGTRGGNVSKHRARGRRGKRDFNRENGDGFRNNR